MVTQIAMRNDYLYIALVVRLYYSVMQGHRSEFALYHRLVVDRLSCFDLLAATSYDFGSSKSASQYNQPPNPVPHNYPVLPDVRLKRLPFYDLLGELLKPSTLGE